MTTQHPGYTGPRRRGLGRGLDALLGPPTEPGAAAAADAGPGVAVLIDVDPELVEPNPEQPRRDFDPESLTSLGESIRTHGLLHPIVVEAAGPVYRLVAGERRLRAVKLAGLPLIQAIVRPAAETARQSLETALTENLARADLSPMEEAAAYARLADTFGMSHEAIALRLGRSRPAVSNTIRLLALPAPVQRAVAQGALSAGHARALLGLSDDERQELMARRAIEQHWSVRQTETAVQAALGRASPVRAPAPAPPEVLGPDDEAVRRGLEAALGLPVALERSARGGRVIVSFHGDEDLDALYRRLGGLPL